MSRCFPYQRPGHLKQGLVESIKLERERILPQTEQELRKRERKEKRKDKKVNDKTQCPAKKFKKLHDFQNGYNGEDQLEKSDLTEEHAPPVCYVSDGSQNRHKRKRELVSYSECKVDGNKIRIKFSLKKPPQPDALIVEKPSCSSNGRVDSNQVPISLVAPVSEQKPCHDVGRKEQCPSLFPSCSVALVSEQKHQHGVARKEQGPSSSRTSTKGNKILKAALQYKTLFEDLLPAVLQPELADDDNGDNWILPKKQLQKPTIITSDGKDVPCLASSISWLQAQYLPEAEIFALPYTVPF